MMIYWSSACRQLHCIKLRMMTSLNGNIFQVTGDLCGEFIEFHAQRPATRSFNVFFDLRLNKQSSEQPWCWWFDTPSRVLWCRCNEFPIWSFIHNVLHRKQRLSISCFNFWDNGCLVETLQHLLLFIYWSLYRYACLHLSTAGYLR